MSDAKIQIILDSTADLAARFQGMTEVIPLTVSFGDQEYIDGVTLTRDEFYTKLEEGKVLPKTSQPSPSVFEEVFEKLREQGKQGIVITVSSKLSGTYQSACIAAQDYPEIRVVDSLNVTIGAGILAEYALDRVQKGATLEELEAELLKKREEICLVAMLDTLEYLMKGGRLSKTAAIAGGVLNIKPVITIKDGEVKVLGKARGVKKANNLLVEQVQAHGADFSQPILLGYSGTSDALLQDYIRDSAALWEGRVDKLEYAQVCSVIGTYAGGGAVAVAFFATKG